MIRSVSKVTTALSNVSSVFQLFPFLVVCSSMISKGFGFVAFFASVETSLQVQVQYYFSWSFILTNVLPLFYNIMSNSIKQGILSS